MICQQTEEEEKRYPPKIEEMAQKDNDGANTLEVPDQIQATPQFP